MHPFPRGRASRALPRRGAEVHGLTQEETARQLGLSLSGAKSRVQRAGRMLQDMPLACCRVEVDSRGSIVDYESPHGCGPASAGAENGCGSCGRA